jgi:hypothetical protein
MPISGGSALEFETKKEQKHYFHEVRNICVEERVEKTRWSHIPITFSEEDVRLQGFPHNDALVIEQYSKLDSGEALGGQWFIR